MNLFIFIFDFYLIKTIKINAKSGQLSREPTWMRHGAQGHVDERAPAWRGGDT